VTATLSQAELPGVPLASRGKVRDIFHVGTDLLIVSTDRLSAFDVVLPDPIPDKGRVLTRLSEFWFRRFETFVPHHLLSTDVDSFPESLRAHREQLEGRAMLVRKCEPLPVECVVRGYLAGSGWKEYRATGKVCGIELPAGLRLADRLPEPIFTPSTKARSGHDENIPVARMRELVGEEVGRMVEERAVKLYFEGAKHALEQGIIIADTKFEFGLLEGRLLLIDEALTPDSSRFWDVEEYQPGESPKSFDKQFVRDFLETLDWDKTPPGPHLPAEVIAGTRQRYREAFRRITGSELD
jgi:phosphoribosylaminoimidazole-succinocarboxamide synthase